MQLEEAWSTRAAEKQALGPRLDDMERMLSTMSLRLGEIDERIAQQRGSPGATSEAERASPTPKMSEGYDASGAGVSAEVAKLLEKRDLACTARDGVRNRLDQVAASERVLEAELALIQTHGLTLPTGEEWNRVRRSDEISWRWHALEQAWAELRRLERRCWLRRLLTLGLWWR